ncbi:MAG TPA: DCC1-like thiol-disulfide oxidoreductase family protein [Mycobacteriales bacterium]|nr:DCC1-like thiol-disulfide oxidoreductase family protein [Mycobacteriales bacterium]
MTAESAQALLIYDGDCAFCTTAAQDIQQHWAGAAGIRAWQQIGAAGLTDLGLTLEDVTTKVWWVDPDGTRLGGHKAVARALIEAGGWRALLGRFIGARLMTWPAAIGYRLVSRYRHLLPGATDACRIDVSQSG